jgi:hypothetical protein
MYYIDDSILPENMEPLIITVATFDARRRRPLVTRPLRRQLAQAEATSGADDDRLEQNRAADR